MRPHRVRALLSLLFALPVLAACANIPEDGPPQPVSDALPRQGGEVIPEPARNADPYALVRDFIRGSGDPLAAEAYLTQDAKNNWHADAPTIIEDTFSTLPTVTDADAPARPNEMVVRLQGRYVGRLGPDHAFVPNVGSYDQLIKVRLQPDGQWRIAEPPPTAVLTISDFNLAYRPVSLHFFDPNLNVLVPDPRYVADRPAAAVPGQVVELLLAGPSDALNGAVRSAIAPAAALARNVVQGSDGALEVNLTSLGELTPETRKLIAAQIVLSLQDVTPSRVRLQVDGLPLIQAQPELRSSDIDSYDSSTTPNAQLPGLVLAGGKLRSLRTGEPIPGPAGAGEYQIVSAAQSIDGQRLAVVERAGGGVRVRIGGENEALREVDLQAAELTRPTWRAVSTGTGSNEVWTVADGNVVRLVRTREGTWAVKPVNGAEITQNTPITDLRLSRDGVRVAVVGGGKLIVGSVVRSNDSDSVVIHSPRPLQPNLLNNVVGVDWLDQDTLTVATSSSTLPVANVEVDGLKLDRYNSSNLTAPLTAITAAPSRQVVITDANGMWTANDIGQVWQPHAHGQGPGAKPFYPG